MSDAPISFSSGTPAYNAYKFSVNRHAAWTSAVGFGKVQFDTKEYDTGNNFDAVTNFRFTAPISGFYHFEYTTAASITSGQLFQSGLYKNGTALKYGSGGLQGGTGVGRSALSATVQAVTGDYFEVFYYGTGGAGEIDQGSYFSGFLVSTA